MTTQCQNCTAVFEITENDLAFYKKMQVPAPVLCPVCRFRRRATFRNETTWYKHSCALCKKSIVTMYNPRSGYTVYCNACWASDEWDLLSCAMNYDPSRPFFDQLRELSLRVPKAATYAISVSGAPNINSEYTNFSGGNKDCYLISNSGPNNENCAYARGLMSARDTFDAYYGEHIERVYEGVNIQKSSGVAWGQNVTDCLDSWFVLNYVGCQRCFGCVNMRHASDCFLNEQLTRAEWDRRVSGVVGSYSRLEEFRKKFEAFSLRFPRKENSNFKSIDCIGDYIVESKNCKYCFEVAHQEDSSYCFSMKRAKDVFDCLGHGRDTQLLYEDVGVGYSSRVLGSWWVNDSQNIEYCLAVRNCKDCFGCEGIHNLRFVILNKQYSEEEYRKARQRIVRELMKRNVYGLFMPPENAFFGYNETIGQDNMPLTKEEALAGGFRWEDDIQITTGKETVHFHDLPDHIQDVKDSILNEILLCAECGRNYKLIRPELEFYRSARIPIPRKCFYCRHRSRVARRGFLNFHDRVCAKCARDIKTSYASDRPEIVYCESCYQTEVA